MEYHRAEAVSLIVLSAVSGAYHNPLRVVVCLRLSAQEGERRMIAARPQVSTYLPPTSIRVVFVALQRPLSSRVQFLTKLWLPCHSPRARFRQRPENPAWTL
jgi:hypothetical protein